MQGFRKTRKEVDVWAWAKLRTTGHMAAVAGGRMAADCGRARHGARGGPKGCALGDRRLADTY
jgi:hypothetical protein